MRFHPFTLSVGAALAVVMCFAGQVDAAPRKSAIRKPAAAETPAKPVEASPEAATAEGASDPAAKPSNFSEAFAEPSATPSDAAATPIAPAGDAAPAPAETVPDPANTSPPTADAPAASDEVAAPKKGDKPTRDFMVGVWAEEGKSCAAALDFKADGTLIGPFPRWELEDGALTLIGSRQKIMLTVVDKNTMHSRRSDKDPPRTLKRCPA